MTYRIYLKMNKGEVERMGDTTSKVPDPYPTCSPLNIGYVWGWVQNSLPFLLTFFFFDPLFKAAGHWEISQWGPMVGVDGRLYSSNHVV